MTWPIEVARRAPLSSYFGLTFLFTWSLLPLAATSIPASLIALSVILTFLAQATRGSVVIATLFHGAVNTFGFVDTAATPTERGWSNALCYGLAALLIGGAAWRRRRADRVPGIHAARRLSSTAAPRVP